VCVDDVDNVVNRYERISEPLTKQACATPVLMAQFCLEELLNGNPDMCVTMQKLCWNDLLHCPALCQRYTDMSYTNDNTMQFIKTQTNSAQCLSWDPKRECYEMAGLPTYRWCVLRISRHAMKKRRTVNLEEDEDEDLLFEYRENGEANIAEWNESTASDDPLLLATNNKPINQGL